MLKKKHIGEINKRLPEDILVIDETSFEFTEDEYVSILSWLRYFNNHFEEYAKSRLPNILFPVISKRLILDFGLYITADSSGRYAIYITDSRRLIFGEKRKVLTTKEIINSYNL